MSKGFQFKQFYVDHSQCGMKVGTDSIVLGSWCQPGAAKRILDVGTGSGLLALMMGQKTAPQTHICAIDIDAHAVSQATFNFISSPWPHKFSCRQIELQTFEPDQQFDLIIANPPYFPSRIYRESDKTRDNHSIARLRARQQDTLAIADLVTHCHRLLNDEGEFYVVLPVAADAEFEAAWQVLGMYVSRQLQLIPAPGKEPLRNLWCLSKAKPDHVEKNELQVKDINNRYSRAYQALCKEFYLHF